MLYGCAPRRQPGRQHHRPAAGLLPREAAPGWGWQCGAYGHQLRALSAAVVLWRVILYRCLGCGVCDVGLAGSFERQYEGILCKRGDAVGVAVVQTDECGVVRVCYGNCWDSRAEGAGSQSGGHYSTWYASFISFFCSSFLDPLTNGIDILNLPLNILTAAFSDPLRLLCPLAPYLLVLLSFVAFVVHNNFTIVLGDASAHVASLHLPQLLYFSAATAFFSWSLLLHVIPAFSNSRTWVWFLAPATVVLPAMAAMVKYNTVLHPYLLADNRHFAFYVFRKFLLKWRWALLSVVPVYYAAWWAVIAVLVKSRASFSATAAKASEREGGTSGVKKQSTTTSNVQQNCTHAPAIATLSTTLLWFVSSTLTLVSAPLVEPRYFIIAWLVWRLQLANPAQSWKWQLWVETLWFVAVNIGTTYIFLKWGFEWENEKGKVQRFMW